jgi:hypothetical protein
VHVKDRLSLDDLDPWVCSGIEHGFDLRPSVALLCAVGGFGPRNRGFVVVRRWLRLEANERPPPITDFSMEEQVKFASPSE